MRQHTFSSTPFEPMVPIFYVSGLTVSLIAGALPAQESSLSERLGAPSSAATQAASDSVERPAGANGTLDLDTLVVTPTRTGESILDVPFTVDSVGEERIDMLRTLPQALRDVPGVMVQETGPAQGSPYIRGFTGFRTLFLIDGIRLNNSVFRDGPNQYAGTIDPMSLSGIEVVKGPSSVLYGSDAIGGTVQAFTKDPEIWDRPIGGEIFTRFATGANYNVHRAELGGAIGDSTAWRAGGSLKDFGDITAGGDSVLLENTGYDEWDGDAKVQHLVDDLTTLTFAFQRVDIDDAPRTHRTIFAVPFAGSTVGSDLQRDFDQTRTLTYARLNTEGASRFDWETETTLSYQRQQERRTRLRTGDRMDEQGFDVGTSGFGFRASRATSFGRFTGGFEWNRDTVDSFINRFADQSQADQIQGPVADDATYDLGGLYADFAIDLTERTTLTAGARMTYAAADAAEVRDPVTSQQTSIDEDWFAATGSVRFESRVVETGNSTVALFGGVSQGFRAPNLSDLTRFDSARSNEFEIPSPGLDPEEFLSFELGVKHETEHLSFQLAGFLTEGDDVIQRILTGATNASGENEVTKANVGSSTIGGVELGASYRMTPDWTAFGTLAWLDGQEDNRDIVGGPTIETVPSRLMPLMSTLGLRFAPSLERWWVEARWIHAEDADRLSLRDITDTSRIPPGGTPGYDVIDVMGSFLLNDATRFTLGLENITDEDYRVHGSGQNRPGRNLIVGLSVSF